jgi:TetR/AcrR family transcriptional regulator
VQNKIRASRDWPDSSRLWAIEVIGGGRHVSSFMKGRLRDLVRDKGRVMAQWAAEGRMDPVDPAHLMFMIWASTQTYADFAAQIAAVLDKDTLDETVFRAAEETVVRIILKGCGIG